MITCEQLLNELSNYLDGQVDAALRTAIETHIKGCRRCAVLVDTTHKTLRIIADERILTLPVGLSHRLRAFLVRRLGPSDRVAGISPD